MAEDLVWDRSTSAQPVTAIKVNSCSIKEMTMHQGHQTMASEMQRCIQECLNCHSVCTTTVNHCLSMGGEHAQPAHITTLLDCAEICQTSANFMLRTSPLHAHTCGVCAEACTRCADECERMASGDQQMITCAETCRRCAESCRQMATMA